MAKGYVAAQKHDPNAKGPSSFSSIKSCQAAVDKASGQRTGKIEKPTPMGTGFGGVSADEFKKGK